MYIRANIGVTLKLANGIEYINDSIVTSK